MSSSIAYHISYIIYQVLSLDEHNIVPAMVRRKTKRFFYWIFVIQRATNSVIPSNSSFKNQIPLVSLFLLLLSLVVLSGQRAAGPAATASLQYRSSWARRFFENAYSWAKQRFQGLAAAPAIRTTGWGFSFRAFWFLKSTFQGAGPPLVFGNRKTEGVCCRGNDGKEDRGA